MRKLIAFFAALVLATAVPAFAATQNVKVGGDITARFVNTGDLDLDSSNADNANQSDKGFMTTTRLYVSADLTDNVSTMIRVLNERDWDSADQADAATDAANEDQIEVDLAYVQLSEFLYSPLTLTIGRQELFWGSGLVIGDGDPNPNARLNLRFPWYSQSSAFDAVRAFLDFDPWTVDIIAAKVDADTGEEGTDDRDEDVYGVNVAYVWPSEWLTEGYYVANTNGDITLASRPEVHTAGIRAEGVAAPIDDKLSLEAELAYQWGDSSATQDIDAWAAILGATYEFDNEYRPVVSVYYDFRSGDEAGGDDEGWNATYYARGIGNLIDQIWINGVNAGIGGTTADPRGSGGNIHAITTSGSFQPIEDVEVALDWVWAVVDEEQNVGSATGDTIGNEIIGSVIYDYTEDVTFSLQGSYFDPDDAFRSNENDAAYELVGSVSVEF